VTDRDTTPNEWDTRDYDDDHAFVFEYGEDVVGLLDPEPGERILDLGCGTGHLSAAIADGGASVVGLDRDPAMLAEARAAHPDVPFVRGDARRVPFDGAFDAVFSNAALHWIPDQASVTASVAAALRPGGRFVAELGGAGNVSTVVEAARAAAAARGYDIESPWYFPTVGEHATLLEEYGFEVRYATLFDRPTELAGGESGLASWLDMFGDSLLAPIPADERDAVVADAAERARDALFDGTSWTADYRRLRFVAVRD